MYEMQGPRPARRCWLTDCSAARHCLTDHCYQIPVRDAGCPAPRPFPELPPGAISSPDTRPECRSPGSPAVSRSHPRDRIRSRYPSEAPVARLLSRFRSCPRNRYLFPGYPTGMPVARLPGRSRSFPRERYPSLAVMNFYSLDLTGHKSFPVAISRFFSHPQDTRSYPPRLAVFPPGYPQIRPQTVEFRGLGRLRYGPRPSAVVVAGGRSAASGSTVTTGAAEQPLPGADRGLGH
jgi:hypothetical protein